MNSRQQRLFDDQPEPWQLDETALVPVATVVFPEGPAQPFDYQIPAPLVGQVSAGQRVRVPLGRGDRLRVAYCVACEHRPAGERRFKLLAGILDRQSLLSSAMLRLTRWMAEHYLCSWGQVLESVLPAGVRGQAGTREATLLHVAPEMVARRAEWKLSPTQKKALEYLIDSPRPLTARQLALAVGCTTAPVEGLRKKGLLVAERHRVATLDATLPTLEPEANHELNVDQSRALASIQEALAAGRQETLLLWGVTGSGKTEVYIRAMQEVLRYRRQAIVLVPEISLTPQTVARFRRRFPAVAVLHSHLSDAERHAHWRRIAAGEVAVVVGARSAIFAPTPHLGLIILDEEHESSFKQESAPRYHARDVALERARAESIPLVLGSATPCLESWQRAQEGAYRLIELPKRVQDRPLPAVSTIDLRLESRDRRARGALSRPLQQAMQAALAEQGQVILLLNRRGFSTQIQCPACGLVVRCPHCEIALTHHRHGGQALCHYCNFQQPTPAACPDCRFEGIRYSGLGTQRLEAEVRARFPEHEILRMDTDSMQRPGSHERAFEAFRSGEVDILLGTQMIAKGLDFPNVLLVGVINADTALHLPDFRASERTFQLLAQVAGRTGRGDRGGRVMIQTLSPEHPAIRAAVRHDFRTFAEQELPARHALAYPPFAEMVRVIVRGPQPPAALQFAEQITERLRERLTHLSSEWRLLGPAPAPLAKLQSMYRFHLQAHAVDGAALRSALGTLAEQCTPPEGVQWVIDVDPLSML